VMTAREFADDRILAANPAPNSDARRSGARRLALR